MKIIDPNMILSYLKGSTCANDTDLKRTNINLLFTAVWTALGRSALFVTKQDVIILGCEEL